MDLIKKELACVAEKLKEHNTEYCLIATKNNKTHSQLNLSFTSVFTFFIIIYQTLNETERKYFKKGFVKVLEDIDKQ